MRSALRITIASAIAAAAFAPALGFAQAKDGYLTDTAGGVVKALGANVCVRSSQWTPALAIAECDPDLVKKKAAPAQKARPAQKAKPQKAKPKAKAKKKKPAMLNITQKIELQGMEFNKAEMTADNKKDFDKFLAGLRKATKARGPVAIGAVIVTGHTDRIGNLGYNMKLSERRAITVKDYIVSKGVDQKLIFWEGKGPKQPIPVTKFCDNKMQRKQLIECLSPNRRVTVEVVGRALNLKPKAKAKKKAAKPKR
ncbi:MAG: OmpA family protein [Burkholderiales bacterium]